MDGSPLLGLMVCVGPKHCVRVGTNGMHIGRVNCRDEVSERIFYDYSIIYSRMASRGRHDELIVSCG